MHGFDGMPFGMGWWWIIGLIFVAVIIWAIVRTPAWGRSANSPANQKSAHDILNERYARGEINKEEYENKKKDLGV